MKRKNLYNVRISFEFLTYNGEYRKTEIFINSTGDFYNLEAAIEKEYGKIRNFRFQGNNYIGHVYA